MTSPLLTWSPLCLPGETGQVRVARVEAVLVLDRHEVAQVLRVAGLQDRAVRRGDDRRADAPGDVHARVHVPDLGEGVRGPSEARRDDARCRPSAARWSACSP